MKDTVGHDFQKSLPCHLLIYNSCYDMHKPLNRLLTAFAAFNTLKGGAPQSLKTKLNNKAEVVSGIECNVNYNAHGNT